MKENHILKKRREKTPPIWRPTLEHLCHLCVYTQCSVVAGGGEIV